MAAILGLESCIYYSDFIHVFISSYRVLKFKVCLTDNVVALECTYSLFIIVALECR